MRFELYFFAIALATLLGGCRSTRVGDFDTHAFYHLRGHYRVRYASGGEAQRSVFGNDWLLENFTLQPDGTPLAAKWTRELTTEYALDTNNDGAVDQRVRAELYDLRYVHRGDGSVIWTRSLPLSLFLRDRELSVIGRDYVDRVGGGSYVDVDFLAETARERRVGTRVVEEGPVTVGGQPGRLVVFDILSIEQREVNPEHTGERVELVLLRPGAHTWPGGTGGAQLGMLVVVGYAARAEAFDAHRADFERMLTQLDVAP